MYVRTHIEIRTDEHTAFFPPHVMTLAGVEPMTHNI